MMSRLSHWSIQKSNKSLRFPATALKMLLGKLAPYDNGPRVIFMRYVTTAFLFGFFCLSLNAQKQQPPLPPAGADILTSVRPQNVPTSSGGEEYRIGQNDLLDITVFEVPELGATARVSASGTVTLSLIGVINASGQTTNELASVIEDELKKKNYVNDPHVSVSVREYASQPVSVLGAVKAPGIYQIKGQKFLLEMLAMAQGLDAAAGKTIQIMRRVPDDPSPTTDPPSPGKTETISIDITDLFQN